MNSIPQDIANQIIEFLPWRTQSCISTVSRKAMKSKLDAIKVIVRAMRAHKIRIQTIVDYNLPRSINLIRANYILYYPHDLRYDFIQLAVRNLPVGLHFDQMGYTPNMFKAMISNLSEIQLFILGW